MSDDIPFEIQMEIIKKVYDVKSLMQFRSVSKPWKSFIDSSDFIKGYGARHTQPHSYILSYKVHLPVVERHFCLVDDNFETLQLQESPLLKHNRVSDVVGTCHGLVCLYVHNTKCYYKYMLVDMLVVWNHSIGKSFGIANVPSYDPRALFVYGFGVCPITSDPTIVKVLCGDNMPWHVQVFTLSSGVWNVIPRGNLPRQSIELNPLNQVVIDRFIYWGAQEKTFMDDDDDDDSTIYHMVVSFDLITKEFQVVDLPHNLTNGLLTSKYVSVSKLRGSLVVFGYVKAQSGVHCGVLVMEHDSSFRKLFSFGTVFSRILGFKKNGETIFVTGKKDEKFTTLDVYDPSSQQIKNLEISGLMGSFFMESYKQSLLLLDHSELRIYCDNN